MLSALMCQSEEVRYDHGYGYHEDQSDLQNISTTNNANGIRIKMINCLSDVDTNFATLQSNELVKEAFIRYNPTLSSSAPMESLFGSTIPNETRQNSLIDSIFEN